MQTTPLVMCEEAGDVVLDLGDVADLTLGEGKSENEDKRKIYN
ncbi:albusnodin family lasso peptide [Nocardiopsis nanhaiensis]